MSHAEPDPVCPSCGGPPASELVATYALTLRKVRKALAQAEAAARRWYDENKQAEAALADALRKLGDRDRELVVLRVRTGELLDRAQRAEAKLEHYWEGAFDGM
jgi:hypothetical protein